MKNMLKKLSVWSYYILPGFLNDLAHNWAAENLYYRKYKKNKSLLKANVRFKELYKNQRCFIVGNGPSINKQDLTPLKNEIVFSVSQGYKHRDFKTIKPKYHLSPQITYGLLNEDDVISYFKEMDDNIGDAELFLNQTEAELVKNNNLFAGRKVNYVYLGIGMKPSYIKTLKNGIPDITNIIPGVSSVPVMCLMVALYMGFKEIYILGVEHSDFRTKEYKYAFAPNETIRNKHFGLSKDFKTDVSNYDTFHIMAFLWEEYRRIRKIAEKNSVRIVNLSLDSELDEFECMKFEDVFKI